MTTFSSAPGVKSMPTPDEPTMRATDRREAIQRVPDTKSTLLVPGVELLPLVGEHNRARKLFTGLLNLAPKASHPLYNRLFSEAMVLCEGDVAVDVEDRRYRLERLDAISIRAHVPRRVVNLSSNRRAVVHVAMASAVPDQRWVNGRFTPVEQPHQATGQKGREHLCRNDPRTRFELAPRAHFQDLFSGEAGAEGICGGYGMFEPGARLPCHRHEFDESITIVHGTATCIVEGERYELADNATALVPEGRCHYFINLTLDPMGMIWVYAGEKPDRIVMDEEHCHPGKAKGNPGNRSKLDEDTQGKG
jgi:quercetin dioxygenase-like cupin family protein